MELEAFLALMGRLAPLELAEEWDNVGLLLAPRVARSVQRVLLTIDFTESVLDEALEVGADTVVAYHPPMFVALKRLLPQEPKGRVLLSAIENRLSIYSPHTALDAVSGGINDWLAEAFPVKSKRPIQPPSPAAALLGSQARIPGVGQGRLLELREPVSLADAVALLKAHLRVAPLRVAALEAQRNSPCIRRVAVCAGAGGSVLSQAKADLYVSGEMRHHDVVAALERGTSVILTEHTNSERGYLPRLRELMTHGSPLDVRVSLRDEDPLRAE